MYCMFIPNCWPYGIGGAARTRLHFHSFGTTAGLHDRAAKARLVHAFYRPNGVDRITKNGVSKNKNKKKVMRCGYTPATAKIDKFSRDLLFCHQESKKTGLHHWIARFGAYIGHCKQLLLLHGCCFSCTTGSFARLIFLVAWTRSRRECR